MSAGPRDRPRVSVNFAITWDGRIATRATLEDVGGGIRNRGDFFFAIERRLAHLRENPVVVRDVGFV